MSTETKAVREQSLKLENCKNLYLTGVKEVLSFDEVSLSLSTELGLLEIRGKGLKAVAFNAETGDMLLEGYIYALVYPQSSGKGFIKRLFS